MRRLAIGISAVVLVALAACAPTTQYSAVDGVKAFTLTVDGKQVPSSDTSYTYKTADYEISFQIQRRALPFTLVNDSDKTIRLVWDSCAIVLPNGDTSRAVSGETTWVTRNDPQAPSVIPSGAKFDGWFFPLKLLNFGTYSGLSSAPMFNYPLTEKTNLRLLLALQVGNQTSEVTFVWSGQPSKTQTD